MPDEVEEEPLPENPSPETSSHRRKRRDAHHSLTAAWPRVVVARRWKRALGDATEITGRGL